MYVNAMVNNSNFIPVLIRHQNTSDDSKNYCMLISFISILLCRWWLLAFTQRT